MGKTQVIFITQNGCGFGFLTIKQVGMNITEIANRIANLHYPDVPKTRGDKMCRRQRVIELQKLVESELKNCTEEIKVIHLNVGGVVTHYTDKIWVDDHNDPDGGYYQPVKKPYKTPRVKIDFLANVSPDLECGAVYHDGLNTFVAISKNQIRNVEEALEKFSVPKKLIQISGGSEITVSFLNSH